MGSLYRSEEMCLAQLYLQSEAAFACVSELGELGMAQFRDLNPAVNAFQRKFVNEVRRCDEMERKLRFLERELKKDNTPMDDDGEVPLAPLPREMIDLEARFEKLENDMKEVNTNQEALKRNFLELNELKHILRKTQNFFEEAAMHHDQQQDFAIGGDESAQSLLAGDRGPFTKLGLYDDNTMSLQMENYDTYEEEALDPVERQQRLSLKLGFVAGVILREKVPAFERVLWRACRGNVFLRYAEIEVPFEDPHTGDLVHKCVFVIFFQGDQLKLRVKKICEGFRATLYPCPETPQERREIAIGVMTRIEDLQTVLNQTEDHRRLVLSQVAKNIRVWLIKVRKIKAIYHTLNMFNVNIAEKCLIGECWCPVADLDKIQLALRRGTEMSGSSVPSILQQMKTDKSPPTYNKTDKFTSGFQALIDSFGVANYREINPAPFTIITFPFLFAVMFGDLGHGLIMFLFGLYCVLNEKKFNQKSDNEIWEMIYGGRYLVLMMGFFSMYTGFLYNECFSRSINIFGSAWNVSAMQYSDEYLDAHLDLQIDPNISGVYRRYPQESPDHAFDPRDIGNPYPYGMDPIWQSSLNKITFQNSYKMKTAVILGFCQMMFGLMLALQNHLYFKNYLTLFCEWIPQVLFLLAVIGYLVILIIFKWFAWTVYNAQTAPSLLIGLINMFMFTPPDPENGNYPLYGGEHSKTQYYVQIFIVLLAVICIPWMLFSKPYILNRRHKQKSHQFTLLVDPLLNPGQSSVTSPMGSRRYTGINSTVDEFADDSAIIHHDHLEAATSTDDVELLDVKEEEFLLSEIMIHQIIHTIEYCLNCISHTASYLRLWALSLAHSELSEVLWTMVMHSGLTMFTGVAGAFMAFIIFWGFSTLTIGILLMMEGLSAFLHALRLHWVEFQSKFYGGQGHMFAPFSFQLIEEGKTEE